MTYTAHTHDPYGFENNFNDFLRTLNNTTVLNLSSNTQIKDLKSMIEKMTYINVEEQLVSFNSRQLLDNKTLGDYGVSKYSILDLSIRMRGGNEDPPPSGEQSSSGGTGGHQQ